MGDHTFSCVCMFVLIHMMCVCVCVFVFLMLSDGSHLFICIHVLVHIVCVCVCVCIYVCALCLSALPTKSSFCSKSSVGVGGLFLALAL